ncbi:MAG: Rpn family recombination-promoting nuclease/putative transposase [Planctomycetes bacterium]|nr:Rpn family recombination-promoting nuclease/putative transposase [Planctomycetota bacterium]
MTSPHDALFRWTFSSPEHAGPLLRALLPAALANGIDWGDMTAIPGTRVDGDQREERSDLVFATKLRGRPALLCLLLEHKSRPDRWTALQVLAYMLTMWREARRQRPRARFLPFVLPVVLHYGRRRWRATTDLWSLFDTRDLPAELLGELRRALPQFAFTPFDFATRSAAEVRAMALSLQGTWSIAWLQFVAAVSHDDDAVLSAVAEWADVARQVLVAPSGQQAFVALQSYLLRITKVDRRRLGIVIGQQFGTETMKKFVSTYDQIRREGEALGEARGEARGTARGQAEGRADMLLRLLERRFGELPAGVRTRVRTASIEDLDAWALRVLDAPALAAVFAPQ